MILAARSIHPSTQAPLKLLKDDTRKATERRLRKMSEEYQPSTFTFVGQAQVLCVGTALVYRVSITITTATSGMLTPSSSSSFDDSAHGLSTHSWMIAMSQAKFLAFDAQARSILNQPSVGEYLTANDDEWKPFEQFVRGLSDILSQYERLHDAFTADVSVEMMQQGRALLEAFLRDCWGALQIIIPALAVETHLAVPLGREIVSLYILIRDFLAFPESILEASCVYANAILSLTDEQLPTHSDHRCCICLERLGAVDASEFPHATAINAPSYSNQSSNPALPRPDDRAYTVKLPCEHLVHENCVMAWLRHNPSCPECRAIVRLTQQ